MLLRSPSNLRRHFLIHDDGDGDDGDDDDDDDQAVKLNRSYTPHIGTSSSLS